MTHTIRYIERAVIDTEKWDSCIDTADNGLLYAKHWWLDGLAENWSGLILNDYEAVMPLTWKKKFGFHYLYQPWFTAALGLFGKKDIQSGFTNFLDAIPPSFKLWDIDVNEYNQLGAGDQKNITTARRLNYMIEVKPYEVIKKEYSRLAKRMLSKSSDNQLTISRNVSAADIISLYQQYYKNQHPAISKDDYHKLSQTYTIATKKENLNTYTALNAAGEIVAFYLVLHDKQYAYSLLGGSTPAGKESAAFYMLTDAAIHDAANNNCTFRFEGSDIPGIAFFNSQFGPQAVEYLHLKRNNLPFPVNLFKK